MANEHNHVLLATLEGNTVKAPTMTILAASPERVNVNQKNHGCCCGRCPSLWSCIRHWPRVYEGQGQASYDRGADDDFAEGIDP